MILENAPILYLMIIRVKWTVELLFLNHAFANIVQGIQRIGELSYIFRVLDLYET
jgi:hypothetical protein